MADGDLIAEPARPYLTALRQLCDERVEVGAAVRSALEGVKKDLRAFGDETIQAVLGVEKYLERVRDRISQGMPVEWREAYADVRDNVVLQKKPMNMAIIVAQRMLHRIELGQEMPDIPGELVNNFVRTVYVSGFESHIQVAAALEPSAPAPAILDQRTSEAREQIGGDLRRFATKLLSGSSVDKLRLPPKRKAALNYDDDV
jgi:hypothetical protein